MVTKIIYTRRSSKVGVPGFPDSTMVQAPSYFKSRYDVVMFCSPYSRDGVLVIPPERPKSSPEGRSASLFQCS
eukprot:466948-Pyramimonas_sp.AAC.1